MRAALHTSPIAGIHKAILLFFGLYLVSVAAVGQSVQVIHAVNKTPIVHATLHEKGNPANTTITDSSGLASLTMFDDSDTIIIQHLKFFPITVTKAALIRNGGTISLYEEFQNLPAFVLTASKSKENIQEIPYKIATVTASDIARENPQTAADALQSSGDVLVQKSQGGGGSPILRGFEANRVLIVVDGVRMNNAIYRSGHLQNAITLDNAIMERVEVQFGPSSVIYGSDALGGVMHFYTRKPVYAKGDTAAITYNTFARYSSANEENTAHLDMNMGYRKLAFLTSVTASRFGNTRTGARRNSTYPDFGKTPFYADRIEGVDTMLTNPDPNIQRGTSYDQLDITQKVGYKPNENLEFSFNTQLSTSSNIPRFDRLNDIRDGELRFSEWYYGPQDRLLVSLSADFQSEHKLFDHAKAVLAFQDVDESRITRRFRSNDQVTRDENVKAYSFNLDFQKSPDSLQRIQYGIEILHNDVASEANSLNIVTGTLSAASTRYPDDGSYLQSAAIYGSYKRFLSKKLVFHAGARYSHVRLESRFRDTTFYQLPFNRIGFNTGALTGNLGLVFRPTSNWQFNSILSSGFRVPNVDDVGKIFDNGDNVIVPNDDIKPEFAYNGEQGIVKSFLNERIRLSGTVFATFLRQVIVRREHVLNGQDSLNYEGELLNLQTNTNASEGLIWGFSFKGYFQLYDHLTLEGTYNLTHGRDQTSDVPLGHIPPEFGKVSLAYRSDKFNASFFSFYNGWKRIGDFAPSGVDNEDESVEEGFPSWYTLNFNSSYSITPKLTLQFAVENLLDHHYRQFASGISAPGRNFRFTLRASI